MTTSDTFITLTKMAPEDDEQLRQDMDHRETKRFHYPLDPNSYQILDEIGKGCSAIVYKALCTTTSTVVAIKSIDLDRSTTNDIDNIRREAKTMSLLSHPNVLKAHCSFTVGLRLWVVMPFMSAGSLQSIMASNFPTGISETCISVILKETLMGLSYLHDQGHLHRDIKAGNILMDSNGSIKLADFGVSASVYESASHYLMLNEITGTPYWMAPEVLHSYNGYSYKADIWSFGITALELAHGRPPLSHLPFSESLVMKITKGVRFSEFQKEEEKVHKNRKFSKYFKDLVGLCLDQDPLKRPSAEKLLKHHLFKNCKGCDFLVKSLLQGLPSVEIRFKEITKLQRVDQSVKEHMDDDECLIESDLKKQRRISGWNFNIDACELNPVFPNRDKSIDKFKIFNQGLSVDRGPDQDEFGKPITSGNENVLSEIGGELDVHKTSWPSAVAGYGGGVDVVGSLMALKRSLDDQREKVIYMLDIIGVKRPVGDGGGDDGDCSDEIGDREEKLRQVIDKLKLELEDEKTKSSSLEMELEFLKLHMTRSTCDV